MSDGVIIGPRLKLMQLLPPELTSVDTSLLVLSDSRRGNLDSGFSVGSDQGMVQKAGFTDFLSSQSLAEMDSFLLFLASISSAQICYGSGGKTSCSVRFLLTDSLE